VPVQEELDMPHIVMRSPLSLAEIPAHFTPVEHAVDDIRIRFMAAYTNARTLLFETYVHEPTINQHVGVVLVERETPGEYTLKLSGMGSPRPTEGIHVAVGLLGDWLAGLHPEATIVTSKVRQR
jgi:hypothetical protein